MKCAFSRKKCKQALRSSINIYRVHYVSDTSLSTRNSCEHIVSPNFFVRDSTVKKFDLQLLSAIFVWFWLTWYCAAFVALRNNSLGRKLVARLHHFPSFNVTKRLNISITFLRSFINKFPLPRALFLNLKFKFWWPMLFQLEAQDLFNYTVLDFLSNVLRLFF